ncbi:hypothetical protein Ddc_01262 [Ditylenchus destructor]|nr:hypothetical protein Ddc_01262 [Ditylenchus destructor]
MITSQRDSEDAAFGDIDLDPIDMVGTSTTAAATAGIQMGLAGASQKIPMRQIASQSSVTQQRLADSVQPIMSSVIHPVIGKSISDRAGTEEAETVPLRIEERRRLKEHKNGKTKQKQGLTDVVFVTGGRPTEFRSKEHKSPWQRPDASPYKVAEGLPPLESINSSQRSSIRSRESSSSIVSIRSQTPSSRREQRSLKKLTGIGKSTSKLPPIPPGKSAVHPTGIRSLGGSWKQLSNITEEDKIAERTTDDLDKLPVSLSLPGSGRPKRKKIGEISGQSFEGGKSVVSEAESLGRRAKAALRKVAQASISSTGSAASLQYSTGGGEPDYVAGDIDLDLPGPYVQPASSAEELRRFSQSQSNRSRDIKKEKPISEKSKSKPTTTLARKIQSRKTAEQRLISSPATDRSQSIEERVHSACITDREPWDASPARENDIKRIPNDWNISGLSKSSGSLTSLTGLPISQTRRTKSSGDMMPGSSRKLRQVTFDEYSIEFKESKKSRSLSNFYARNQKQSWLAEEGRPWIKNEQKNWFEKLKKSMDSNNEWLNYD